MHLAYLFHHNALVDGEAKLLIDKGHQVYLPVVCPYKDACYYGPEVTKDKRAVKEMNQDAVNTFDTFDFYFGTPAESLTTLMLTTFDCIFIPIINIRLLSALLEKTSGTERFRCRRIFVRVFGREHPFSYSELLQELSLSQRFVSPANKKIVFLSAYREIVSFEPEAVQQRSMFCPLPMDQNLYTYENTWQQSTSIPKMMFVCSRAEEPYYAKVFQQFVIDFGVHCDFDLFGKHSETGAKALQQTLDQLTRARHGRKHATTCASLVRANLPREEFVRALQTYRVMFYHSHEPRHLHYHPLEAIVIGMPVVFKKPSLLDNLTGGNSAGACETAEEAREKLERILSNDTALIKQIVQDNNKVLTYFANASYLDHISHLLDSPLPIKRPCSEVKGNDITWEDACSSYITDFVAPHLDKLTPNQWEFEFLRWKIAHPSSQNRDMLDEVRLEWLGFMFEGNDANCDGVSFANKLIQCGQRHSSKPKEIKALEEFITQQLPGFQRKRETLHVPSASC